MIPKNTLKQKAIAWRKEGKTYGEILEVIPVAKSTLSLWLQGVGLAKKQFQTLTDKKRASQLRGGAARKNIRLAESGVIFSKSEAEIGKLSKRELFLIGVALYWAEGAKAKEYRPSVGIDFANSDPDMVRIFVAWLKRCFDLKPSDFMLTIHLHDNHRDKMPAVEKYWLVTTGLPASCLTKPIYKTHNPKTKRKNTGDAYMGLIAVSVRRSTNMNRRVQGWIYGIIKSQK